MSFSNEFIESLFIEVLVQNDLNNKNIIIGVIYRPPDTDINLFVALITDMLAVIKTERKTCYIMGDFNINLINATNHIPTSEFLEVMYSHAFTPLITKPTLITSSTATLIDNIFTNRACNSFHGIFLTDISDHLPIFCIAIKNTATVGISYYKRQRQYKPNNIAQFSEKMRVTNWQAVLSITDPQLAYSTFLNMFMQCYESCFPIKSKPSVYKSRKPWLSSGLLKSIKTINKLYVKYLCGGSSSTKLLGLGCMVVGYSKEHGYGLEPIIVLFNCLFDSSGAQQAPGARVLMKTYWAVALHQYCTVNCQRSEIR